MKLPLCFQVGLVRFFRRVESANVASLTLHSDTCPPTSVDRNHTHKTGLISLVWLAYIFRVACFINQSKVAQSVVRFVTVNMVNQTNRPIVVCNQPNQPVCLVDTFTNTNSDVTVVVDAPCHITNLNTSGGSLTPHKFSGFRTVLQYLFDFFGGKIDVAHLAFPVMRFNINTGITT